MTTKGQDRCSEIYAVRHTDKVPNQGTWGGSKIATENHQDQKNKDDPVSPSIPSTWEKVILVAVRRIKNTTMEVVGYCGVQSQLAPLPWPRLRCNEWQAITGTPDVTVLSRYQDTNTD